MPQYRIPWWPARAADQPPPKRRRTRLDADAPRHAHLPVVAGTPQGTIRVVRGDAHLGERVRLVEEVRRADRAHPLVEARFLGSER
jgi:hypothetical protein